MKKFILVFLVTVLLNGCQVVNRGFKNFMSETVGLNRVVEVYDYNGNLLKTYEGRIDVRPDEVGNNRVLFEVNGKRVLVSNAIVIVEEAE